MIQKITQNSVIYITNLGFWGEPGPRRLAGQPGRTCEYRPILWSRGLAGQAAAVSAARAPTAGGLSRPLRCAQELIVKAVGSKMMHVLAVLWQLPDDGGQGLLCESPRSPR